MTQFRKCFRLHVLTLAAGLLAAVLIGEPLSRAAALGDGSPAQASATVVPGQIQFAGSLAQSSSATLPSNAVGATFALYGEQSGGTALWMETQNVSVDAAGAYNVLLGAETSGGIPQDIFASGEARWLEVSYTDAQGATITQPRVLLVSVPYALKAGDAQTLGGLPASAFLLKTAALNERVSDAGGLAISAGDVLPATAVAGTGTANKVTKWIDGAGTLGDSLLFDNGFVVGLGTTTPSAALHISLQDASIILGGAGTHSLSVQGTGSNGRLGQDNDGFFFASDTNGKALKMLTQSNNVLQEWMRITAGGQIGMGTQTPSAALHLSQQDASFLIDGAGTHSIAIQGPGSNGRFGQDGEGMFFASDTAGKAFKFLTSNGVLNEWMRITPSGNIGIGTTTPATALDVNGTVKMANIQIANGTAGAGKVLTATDANGNATWQPGGGTGTVTSITAGTGLLASPGNPITTFGTLSFDQGFGDGRYARLGAANNFSANQSITGNVSATNSSVTDFSSAVLGNETGATGQTRGVTGLISSTSDFAVGVLGSATGGSGQLRGVLGTTNSITNNAIGVLGTATAASGQTFGVSGTTASTTDFSAGVSGNANGISGQIRGVAGFTNSTTNNAVGVFGQASGTSGATFGVQGNNSSLTDNAVGVRGNANGTSGITFGVQGFNSSNTDTAAGVRGIANGTGAGRGVWGTTNGAGAGAIGVFGQANSPTPLGATYGVRGDNISVADGSAGVRGNANGASGITRGVTGVNQSTTDSSVGVLGVANASTGATYGVQGVTNSTTTTATGVYGAASAATGEVYGVHGITNSTTDFAAGVVGEANGATGWTFGVSGQTLSSNGLAAGGAGISSDTGVGASNGVFGVGLIPTAVSGAFVSIPGTGKLISGLKGSGVDGLGNPILPFTEVFDVLSTGDVVSKTGDFQALAAGKGLIMKSPDGLICARLSIANGTGALVSTVVACPVP